MSESRGTSERTGSGRGRRAGSTCERGMTRTRRTSVGRILSRPEQGKRNEGSSGREVKTLNSAPAVAVGGKGRALALGSIPRDLARRVSESQRLRRAPILDATTTIGARLEITYPQTSLSNRCAPHYNRSEELEYVNCFPQTEDNSWRCWGNKKGPHYEGKEVGFARSSPCLA